MSKHPFRRQSGLSLVEHAIVLWIVAVLVATALPSLARLRDSLHLEAAAAQLRGDLQHARGLSVTMDRPVRLRVESVPGASCYVVYAGPAAGCSCLQASGPACSADAMPLRTVQFDRGHPVGLRANSGNVSFDGTHGTVTPTATYTVDNRRGDSLKVVVNIMGRTRTCLATGTLRGYPPC